MSGPSGQKRGRPRMRAVPPEASMRWVSDTPCRNAAPWSGGLGGSLFGGRGCRDRTGILALGLDVAIDELDDRHRGGVAVAETRLQHAGVATLARLVALSQRADHLGGQCLVAQRGDQLAAGMEAATLAQRDELFDDG